MKTRTFIFEKDEYTKYEVMDIVAEIIEEAKQKGFSQYDEIYVEEEDYKYLPFIEAKTVYTYDIPKIYIRY